MRDVTLPWPVLLLGAALLLPVAGCERFDDAPRETARAFWADLEAGDVAGARARSDAASDAVLEELAEELPLRDLELGEILRNEQTALVETRAVARDTELVFHTHLQRRDGRWRVNVRETRRELRRTAVAAAFEQAQEALSESADMLVEEFEKRALEASEALREAFEELERSLREEPPPPST